MKKYILKFLSALIIVNLIGCGNSQQNSDKNSNFDSMAKQFRT